MNQREYTWCIGVLLVLNLCMGLALLKSESKNNDLAFQLTQMHHEVIQANERASRYMKAMAELNHRKEALYDEH